LFSGNISLWKTPASTFSHILVFENSGVISARLWFLLSAGSSRNCEKLRNPA